MGAAVGGAAGRSAALLLSALSVWTDRRMRQMDKEKDVGGGGGGGDVEVGSAKEKDQVCDECGDNRYLQKQGLIEECLSTD